nr:V-type ATP synthase subunit D [Blautia argi]
MDPNTFPTKGNLILAKNSLALSRQGFDLMDKKRNILIRELMDLIDQAKDIQSQIDVTFRTAYAAESQYGNRHQPCTGNLQNCACGKLYFHKNPQCYGNGNPSGALRAFSDEPTMPTRDKASDEARAAFEK